MAELWASDLQDKAKLKDLLKSSGQPISEEQAWALCYQCSCNFLKTTLEFGTLPVLKGLCSIYIHQDGAVSFSSTAGTLKQNQSEEKVIEQLGIVVYSALDWGLKNDVERVLSDSLDYLLFRMLGLNPQNSSPIGNLQRFNLNDIIKECMARLLLPNEASAHYTAVCSRQYAVHMEICKLLRTIENSKQNLMKLDSTADKRQDCLAAGQNWGALWNCVMNELRAGIRLCCAKDRCYNAQPVEYVLTPYEMLMEDIRGKRYTLRKVEDQNSKSSSKSEENLIMDLICALKPASERKLRERPQEEPSLHELLMSEIKSSKTLKSTADSRKGFSQDEDLKMATNLCSSAHNYSYYAFRLESKWRCLPPIDFPDNQTEEKIIWNTEFSYESSSEQRFSDLTSSSTDLVFHPAWTSSQVDIRINCRTSQDKLQSSVESCDKMLQSGHKRSSSYDGSFQGHSYDHGWEYQSIHLPPTILELAPVRRMMVKTEMSVFSSSREFPGLKTCSSCRKRLLCYRILCKFCDRAICPECRVEMLMPYQKCMKLAISFFKAMVLNKESDPVSLMRSKDFLRDSSSIPLLLFHPKHVSGDISFQKWLMYNWTSMPICLKCQEYIVGVVNQSHLRCDALRGESVKSRSMSDSSMPFVRH
ncbi:protein spire homolog 1-like [Hyperolius riggenbachi]|uniref:protein spire homolog 1-like n=1 Tax=Hyperolius riggenbachi TaxID=752182 RepID=UPI0035A30645